MKIESFDHCVIRHSRLLLYFLQLIKNWRHTFESMCVTHMSTWKWGQSLASMLFVLVFHSLLGNDIIKRFPTCNWKVSCFVSWNMVILLIEQKLQLLLTNDNSHAAFYYCSCDCSPHTRARARAIVFALCKRKRIYTRREIEGNMKSQEFSLRTMWRTVWPTVEWADPRARENFTNANGRIICAYCLSGILLIGI